MSAYGATVVWQRGDADFSANQYSRAHDWLFDGGLKVPASASPDVVPLPHSVAENVDPEEAFVAAISSCHMLVFLAIASKRKYVVESYHDDACGVLERDSNGRESVTRVQLNPKVVFSGDKRPDREQLEKMHHRSHELCFITNSVKTRITTEIRE